MVESASEQIRKLRNGIRIDKIRDEFDVKFNPWLEQKRQIREDQEGA